MMDTEQAIFVQQLHNDGKNMTVAVPGMIRWEDEEGDGYFIKSPRPGSYFFVIGSEQDGRYNSSLAFMNEDAEHLIQQIAKFAGLTVEVTE